MLTEAQLETTSTFWMESFLTVNFCCKARFFYFTLFTEDCLNNCYYTKVISKICTSSHSEVFFWKGVLKICCKFTGEHPCRKSISIKLQSNFIEIALWHECSPVNLLPIFRTPFPRKTSGGCFWSWYRLYFSWRA